MSKIIDVWDIGTFDQEVMEALSTNSQLVRDYLTTDRRQFDEREAATRWMPQATNTFARAYMDFVEAVGRNLMQSRTIRAWHYTRLTDEEVNAVRKTGIIPGTLDTLRQKLDAQAIAGRITTAEAEALYAASPCHHREQQPGRLGKFWMTSDPVLTDDSGVELLLGNWGGETTYFWLEDENLKRLVAGIGRPRVLEFAVPIASTNHWYAVGKAVVAAFARTLGCHPDRGAFDLYSMTPLSAAAMLAIHTEGDANFKAMARGYPTAFVTSA